MFAKNVYSIRNLPVEEKERKWTDCLCTIIGAIFALTLFIIACCSFNKRTSFTIQNISCKSTIQLNPQENCATWISLITPLFF